MTIHSQKSATSRIAYFISPHGYGHAARASAVMAAIHELNPAVRFEIFTTVPHWFFQDSLHGPVGYHSLLTDIGLAQKTSLAENLPETLRRLDRFLPFDDSQIKKTAELVNQLGCQLVMCDIAPMGITVARKANIPSVLIENFTWDWIYEGYVTQAPRLRKHIAYLAELFDAADYRVQTQPLTRQRNADLTTTPVSRKSRTNPRQTRQQLGIPDGLKLVLITMGGVPWNYTFLEQLTSQAGVYFLIPGSDMQTQIRNDSPAGSGGVVLLPSRSEYFHPDLVHAADAVIGKAGYSTVAEVYHAGAPFGYVERPLFRETQALTLFIEQEMEGRPISEREFQSGEWLSSLAELLALPRIDRNESHGADQVAGFICKLLGRPGFSIPAASGVKT